MKTVRKRSMSRVATVLVVSIAIGCGGRGNVECSKSDFQHTIASAMKNKPLPLRAVIFGEVGLSGEIRRVAFDEKRRAEAKRFGYSSVIAPPEKKTLAEALNIL